MGKANTITLSRHYQEFCDSLIESGRYITVSDAVRAGLRLLEQEEKEMALTEALQQGLNSGISPHTVEDIVNSLKGNDAGATESIHTQQVN